MSFTVFAPLQEKKKKIKKKNTQKYPQTTSHLDHNSEFKIIRQKEIFFVCAPFFIFTQVKISGMRKTKQYGEQKG